MRRDQLLSSLGQGLFGDGADEISIKLDQPSIGRSAMCGVEVAYDGFDWEMGHFLLCPDTPLVSWEYLEEIHPGIREQIEEERKSYARRPRRVIVAGSRGFGFTEEERALARRVLDGLVCPPYVTADNIEIISGGARGADTLGEELAAEFRYALRRFPADWDKYGKAAGYIRNQQMADYAAEDLRKWKGMLIAFWDGESKGTANMIDIARKAGLDVQIVSPEQAANKADDA